MMRDLSPRIPFVTFMDLARNARSPAPTSSLIHTTQYDEDDPANPLNAHGRWARYVTAESYTLKIVGNFTLREIDTPDRQGEDDWANAVAPWDARRVIGMRRLSILCAALLCFSLTASAQDSTATVDASSPAAEPAEPASLIPADREPWQIGVGFQFQQYSVLGQKFHDFAYQAEVTRYFNNWFGIEGTALAGFGKSGPNPSITANSLFLGGGPHISLTNSHHFEPWVHVIVGWERFRFTQSDVLGSNSHVAFMGGGGVDYKIGSGRLYWRVQADFMGTNIGPPSFSKNYFVGTGLIFNF
jgi:hypothetical protein